MTELIPIHFYDAPIEVIFDKAPAREKTPDCPNGFTWNGKTYRILETLSEWNDFTRRGKFARNMRPAHAAVASTRGSLNVGRFYFRVRVMITGSATAGVSGKSETRIYDIYYDRAIKSVDDRKGQWFIYRELVEKGAADV
jgi:hypothetical protein